MNNKGKFVRYAEMLRDWSGRMNLVAPSTLDNIETRHFADCAQLADVLPRGAPIIDLGSGAGFPGRCFGYIGLGCCLYRIDWKKSGIFNRRQRRIETR